MFQKLFLYVSGTFCYEFFFTVYHTCFKSACDEADLKQVNRHKRQKKPEKHTFIIKIAITNLDPMFCGNFEKKTEKNP